MKIGLFNGSFDPIHKGHIELAKFAIKALNLDKLIFIPSYRNPFKKDQKYLCGFHRAKMISLVLPNKCEISNFEINKKRQTFANEVIEHFQPKKNKLYYLIGSDQLEKLEKWKKIGDNFQNAQFVVFQRTKKINKRIIEKHHLLLLDNPFYDYASCEYKNGDLNIVHPLVQKYIAKHLLYLEAILENTLPYNRLQHSLATGKLAAEYAKIYQQNSKHCYFAGITHDIAKYWSEDQHKFLLSQSNLKINELPKSIWHQYSGAIWLEKIYLLPYHEISQAVGKHTTAALKMDIFDKIIYVADKLAQGRRYLGIQELRKIALKDIDLAFKLLLDKSRKELLESNMQINLFTEKIWEKWLKK